VIGALAGVALMAGGVALIAGGSVGLRRQLTAFPRSVADARLSEDGAFRVIRNQTYCGGSLLALGSGSLAASVPTLLRPLLLALFFDMRSRREEAWLGEAFPTDAGYRRRTSRLVSALLSPHPSRRDALSTSTGPRLRRTRTRGSRPRRTAR
jgi:protein-S-isoprenylcysteine O-methyltransferase Ste14